VSGPIPLLALRRTRRFRPGQSNHWLQRLPRTYSTEKSDERIFSGKMGRGVHICSTITYLWGGCPSVLSKEREKGDGRSLLVSEDQKESKTVEEQGKQGKVSPTRQNPLPQKEIPPAGKATGAGKSWGGGAQPGDHRRKGWGDLRTLW